MPLSPSHLIILVCGTKLLREPGVIQMPVLRKVLRRVVPHLGYQTMLFYCLTPMLAGWHWSVGRTAYLKPPFTLTLDLNFTIDRAI